MTLKAQPDQRAVILGQYILENKATVRAAAKKFGISKSTVHMDVTQKNGNKIGQAVLDEIEIKGVFLSKKNPLVKFGLIIK